MNIFYIIGVGVSVVSGILIFCGEDGFWIIGSKNYMLMEMVICVMYENNLWEFLVWYYYCFVMYWYYGFNEVYYWLSDKNFII